MGKRQLPAVQTDQLELPLRDEGQLRAELETRTNFRLDLTVTDNSSSVITVKHDRKRGIVCARVHRMFLSASPQVVAALANWMTSRRKSSHGLLDDFIDTNRHLMEPKPRRRARLRCDGRVFDLRKLYGEVNEAHFQNSVKAGITWGRMPSARRRRSIRFGSFTPEENLIRIHPLLDQEFVPEYFVRYIVFHEMLHAHLGISESTTGRRRIHTPEFNRIERAYPDFDRAVAWMETPANLNRLLSGAQWPIARAV